MSALEDLMVILYAEGLGVWTAVFSFWFGACWGSFLQACYYRIPRGISIVHPPSRCPSCDHRLSWWENQPVLGWLCLRGYCRHCGVKIPFRYLWVEVVCGTLASVMTMIHLENGGGDLSRLLVFLSLSYLYLLMSKIDITHGILPDALTLSVLLPCVFLSMSSTEYHDEYANHFFDVDVMYAYICSIILCCYFSSLMLPWLRSGIWVFTGAEWEQKWYLALKQTPWFDDEAEPKPLLWLSIGFMLWLTLEFALKLTWPPELAQHLVLALGLLLLTRSLGALLAGREALGMGDVKLIMLLVLLHPNGHWLFVLGLACCLGIVVALLQFGFKLKGSLPFGPYLCFASWVFLALDVLGWKFGGFFIA